MKTEAAVLVETARPLVTVELDIPALQPGQVLVELACSGVCHTQLLEARGHRGDDPYLPHCLGHEGAGAVIDTGAGVAKVKPGDPVILSWLKGSGANVPGTVYGSPIGPVNAGGVTTFQRHAVVSENRLTPLPAGVDPATAALLGCALPTGMGAVLNTANAQRGQSVVVFGAGGVGLCAIAAAAAVGCAPVIAVDINPAKLDTARAMGATDVVDASTHDAVEAITQRIAGGVDVAIEATGRPAVMARALACVRPRGGVAVIVGNARHGERIEIDPREFNQGKRLLGTWGGDSDPDRDLPRFAELLRDRAVRLDPLLGATYPLEKINDALDDLEAGQAVRPMIELSSVASGQPSRGALATTAPAQG